MSVQSEIDRIKSNIAGAYSAVADMGGTLPEEQVSDNLEEAVRSIPAGGGWGDIPSGGIIIWPGTEVPDGWALCDGSNGTPDLRDRFILGAGTRAVGETGGSEDVTLTVEQMPKHSHTMTNFTIRNFRVGTGTAYPMLEIRDGVIYDDTPTLIAKETGSSDAHSNMPPYYVLCYIMKL